jgi:hypothetical protein
MNKKGLKQYLTNDLDKQALLSQDISDWLFKNSLWLSPENI